jgi:ElaB/YqjD/DUF883 family membrane-anchored ribosome-binding protein
MSLHKNHFSHHVDCEVCCEYLSTIICPLCNILFCVNCADSFHNVGSSKSKTQLLAHKLKFEYIEDREFHQGTLEEEQHNKIKPIININEANNTGNNSTANSPRSPKSPGNFFYPSDKRIIRRHSMAGNELFGALNSDTDPDDSFDMNIHEEPQNNLNNQISNISPGRGRSISEIQSPDSPNKEFVFKDNKDGPYQPARASSIGATTPSTNSPLASLSSTQPLGAINSPFRRVVHSNMATFKLIGYCLTYPSKQTNLDNITEDTATYTITIDPNNCTLNITNINSNTAESVYHTRHFTSIANISQDVLNARKFSIQFRDSQPIAKCLAMQPAEAELIFSMLNSNLSSIATNQTLLNERDIILAMKVAKKVKISYSNRWLVLKKFTLKIYKNNKFHVPSNILALNTIKLKLNDDSAGKNNVLTLETPEKSLIFKFLDAAERDTFVALMFKAVETKISPNINYNAANANDSTIDSNNLEVSAANGSHLVTAEHLHRAKTDISALSEHNVAISTANNHPYSANSTLPRMNHDNSSPALVNLAPQYEEDNEQLDSVDQTALNAINSIMNNGNLNEENSSAASAHAKLAKSQQRRSRRSISRDFNKIITASKYNTALLINDSDTLHTNINNKIEFTELNTTNTNYSSSTKPNKIITIGVYELMQTLYQSMHGGCAITANLYLPKQCWYQNGVKILSFEVKLESFDILRSALRTWQTYSLQPNNDIIQLNKQLIELRELFAEIQNKLAQFCSFVHSVKEQSSSNSKDSNTNISAMEKIKKSMKTLSKTVSRATAKASKDKIENTEGYIIAMKQTLQFAQVFKDIQQNVANSSNHANSSPHGGSQHALNEFHDHLLRISEFFYSVVVNIIIRDMKTIVKRYIKHCTKTLSGNH